MCRIYTYATHAGLDKARRRNSKKPFWGVKKRGKMQFSQPFNQRFFLNLDICWISSRYTIYSNGIKMWRVYRYTGSDRNMWKKSFAVFQREGGRNLEIFIRPFLCAPKRSFNVWEDRISNFLKTAELTRKNCFFEGVTSPPENVMKMCSQTLHYPVGFWDQIKARWMMAVASL